MKKILCFLLAALMCLGFVGCTGNGVDTSDTNNDVSSDSEQSSLGFPEDLVPNKTVTLVVPYDTVKYDIAEAIGNGSNHKVFKNDGTTIDGTIAKLSVGANTFRVKYTVSFAERVCEVRIARRDGFRVVFNSNGGSFVETQYVEDAAIIDPVLVTPTRERYKFSGWYDTDGNKVDIANTPITSDRTYTARWEGPTTFAMPSTTNVITYSSSSAHLNIVWKDYDNAFDYRPSEVLCELKNTTSGKTYEVKVTKTTAEFVGEAPKDAVISQGAGNWTVMITGLNNTYTFVQKELGSTYYTTKQSGTAVTNYIDNYDPTVDDTSALMTENGRFYDLAGNVIVLKGTVTMNVGWQTFTANTSSKYLERMQDEGANCVRMTVMISEDYYQNNSKRPSMMADLRSAIKRTTELGMYCIVDWGILMDGDDRQASNNYLAGMLDMTKEFFSTLAEEHVDNPYVIYEVCNEPQIIGSLKPWENHIRPFEESVIRAIRETGSQAIVIAAPNTYARKLSEDNAPLGDDPIDKPFPTDVSHNVAFTFHCYAYSTTYNNINYAASRNHGWRFSDAIRNGLTIVITEFSPATASIEAQSTGGTEADYHEGDKYMNVILMNDVSYTLFRGIAASGSSQTSSQHMFIAGNDSAVNNGTWTYEMLAPSGKWFYDHTLGSTGFIKKADFQTEE